MSDHESEFSPHFYWSGGNEFYEDGRVHGCVDTRDFEGAKCMTISGWSSHCTGEGNTTAALEWFRSQGFKHITANGIGMIYEDGSHSGDSVGYWLHMHSRGLVDTLLDDEGVNVTPAPLPKTRPRPGI
jgi:hypothetical protein